MKGTGFRPCINQPESLGFTGCGKTHVLCQGTTLVGP
jgi:hypothetical protein